MKLAQKSINRMKNILRQDKEKIKQPLINMLKSDVYSCISGYFEIYPGDIDIVYTIDENGFYVLDIMLKSRKIKKINFPNL